MYLGYGYYHYEKERLPMCNFDLTNDAELSRKLSKGEKLTLKERQRAIAYNTKQRLAKQQGKKKQKSWF